ncbi:MAG TPA: hypothetical protein VLX28_00840 [Thermoanaerobaculia bacterium]|nr:hypothetical protein [Thermoanaerobaculia bacterium]
MASYDPDWTGKDRWQVSSIDDPVNPWGLTATTDWLTFEGDGDPKKSPKMDTDDLMKKGVSQVAKECLYNPPGFPSDSVKVSHSTGHYIITRSSTTSPATLTCALTKGSGGITWTATDGG